MIDTHMEHVPLAIKTKTIEAHDPEDESDESESDFTDEETSLIISSDEEAELETQRIQFHELISRILSLRERGNSISSSSESSSPMIMSEKSTTSVETVRSSNRKRYSKRTYSSTSMASTVTSINEMESCGNIVANYEQSALILNCTTCNRGYRDLQAFAQHLNDIHQLFLLQGVDTEAKRVEIQPDEVSHSSHVRTDSDSELKTKKATTPVEASIRSRSVPDSSNAKTMEDAQIKKDLCQLKAPYVESRGESCGNIFILNRQKLVLTCGHCQCKYATLQLFRKHLRQQHHVLEDSENETLNSQQKSRTENLTLSENPTKPMNNSSNVTPMVTIPGVLSLTSDNVIPKEGCSENHSDLSMSSTSPKHISEETETKAMGNTEINVCEKQIIKQRRRCYELNIPKSCTRTKRKSLPLSSTEQTVEQTRLRPKRVVTKTTKDCNLQEPSSSSASTTSEKQEIQETISQIKNRRRNDKKVIRKNPLKVLQCDFCMKTFTKVTRLNDHKRVHTGEKPYKCNICGKQFRIKMRLTEHNLRHRKEKAYKCDICGHAVATRQDLTLHQRHHKGDKRYHCSQCPKAFVRGSDLKIHTRIHTGEKPFKCEVCQKAFRANQNLIVHRKTHQAHKEFKCEYCDKYFMRNIDRKVHYRTHTGEKPFKCEICGRGYSSRFHVRTHIARDHLPGPPRQRQKPGPKPKHIKEELERQKKLTQNLEKQVFEQKQQYKQQKQKQQQQKQQQQSMESYNKQRHFEEVSPEETMRQVSLALKIALEDDYDDQTQITKSENKTSTTVANDVIDNRALLQEKHIISTSSRVFLV